MRRRRPGLHECPEAEVSRALSGEGSASAEHHERESGERERRETERRGPEHAEPEHREPGRSESGYSESQSRETERRGPRGFSDADAHAIRAIVKLALDEDLGPGDATSESVVPAARRAVGRIIAKDSGVLSGVSAVRAVVEEVDASVELIVHVQDGQPIAKGTEALTLRGSARSLLAIERTALNFLQRLSGVATLTRRYAEALEGTTAQVIDTRKTTPGFRILEKAAVRHGGGSNHRIGLYDAMMIKDNHIIAAGGITEAVRLARSARPELFLVVEARTQAEVEELAPLQADQILLDNMEPAAITQAVRVIREVEREQGLYAAWIEVSGGVTLDTIRAKAVPGVDLISVGALTHSAKALDLSLDLELQ